MLNPEELKDIISAAQNGDQVAFERLYDAYSSALYGVNLSILGNKDAAQDAVQEAFVKICKSIHAFDPKKGSFFTWILNINRNTSIDAYRKTAKQPKMIVIEKENINDHWTEQKTDNVGLIDLLNILPEKQQVIIEYIYFKGFTQKETAEALDIPIGTVKTRTRKALSILKNLFILLLAWI